MKYVSAHGNEAYEGMASELHMNSSDHLVASQHLGHIIIFGGGLVAVIGLLIYNYLENRQK